MANLVESMRMSLFVCLPFKLLWPFSWREKCSFLTGLKPADSNKTCFRVNGFWQREHVGGSSSIKNLCDILE